MDGFIDTRFMYTIFGQYIFGPNVLTSSEIRCMLYMCINIKYGFISINNL